MASPEPWDFSEYRAGKAPAQMPFYPIENLHDLDLARQYRKQRSLPSFRNRKLSGAKMQICGRFHEPLKIALRERGEQWDCTNLVDLQHEKNAPARLEPQRQRETVADGN